MGFSENLHLVQNRIAEAAVRVGRKPEEISLLAVTKTFPPETIRQAYGVGLREFGENRVQEALGKMEGLPADSHWHLIGQLQTNKINKIIGRFTLIHSVDSIQLAQALSARLSGSTQDILLEVNTSGEASKSGVRPEESIETAKRVASLPGLHLKGLMTVGPLTVEVSKQREAFKGLKGLFDDMRGKEWAGSAFSALSMGMSSDFEIAIEEGSTLVRLGTALFGARQ